MVLKFYDFLNIVFVMFLILCYKNYLFLYLYEYNSFLKLMIVFMIMMGLILWEYDKL